MRLTTTNMKRHFTHYWANATWTSHEHQDGEPLYHTAGNLFRRRGVRCGDLIYVVTGRKGRLYLLGRLTVALICGPNKAKQLLCADDVWDAREHIIATSATLMRFDFEVPTAATQQLLFIRSGGSSPLRFVESGHLDQQTLRGVRELEPASALLLDELLPTDTTIPNTDAS
jgi:hypothetical protein